MNEKPKWQRELESMGLNLGTPSNKNPEKKHSTIDWIKKHPLLVMGAPAILGATISYGSIAFPLRNLHTEETSDFKRNLPTIGLSEKQLIEEQARAAQIRWEIWETSSKSPQEVERIVRNSQNIKTLNDVNNADKLMEQIKSNPEYIRREAFWRKVVNAGFVLQISPMISAILLNIEGIARALSRRKRRG